MDCVLFTSKEKNPKSILVQLPRKYEWENKTLPTHTFLYIPAGQENSKVAKIVKIPHRPIHMSFRGYIEGTI